MFFFLEILAPEERAVFLGHFRLSVSCSSSSAYCKCERECGDSWHPQSCFCSAIFWPQQFPFPFHEESDSHVREDAAASWKNGTCFLKRRHISFCAIRISVSFFAQQMPSVGLREWRKSWRMQSRLTCNNDMMSSKQDERTSADLSAQKRTYLGERRGNICRSWHFAARPRQKSRLFLLQPQKCCW